jgi:uncharacterized coiled-coil DUF342 family protein
MDRETNNTSWLSDLEEKVQEAAKRLRELRTENAELRTTVSELEGRLIGAEEAKQAVASWESERDEVQQRVNTLVSHLDELLED